MHAAVSTYGASELDAPVTPTLRSRAPSPRPVPGKTSLVATPSVSHSGSASGRGRRASAGAAADRSSAGAGAAAAGAGASAIPCAGDGALELDLALHNKRHGVAGGAAPRNHGMGRNMAPRGLVGELHKRLRSPKLERSEIPKELSRLHDLNSTEVLGGECVSVVVAPHLKYHARFYARRRVDVRRVGARRARDTDAPE